MRRRKRLSITDCFGKGLCQLHFQLLLCDPVARAGLGAGRAGTVLGLFLSSGGSGDEDVLSQQRLCPQTPMPHFSCQGVRAGAGVLLSDIPLSPCPAWEALPRWQQMGEVTVTVAGDLPAGTTRLFLGTALCLQVSHQLSPDFSLPLKR